MKTLEEIKKEYYKKFTFRASVVRESDLKKVYGLRWNKERIQPDEVWNFIESTISQTKQELIENFIEELHHIEVSPDLDMTIGRLLRNYRGLLQKLSNK